MTDSSFYPKSPDEISFLADFNFSAKDVVCACEQVYGAPRTWEIVESFLNCMALPSQLYIYGAGTEAAKAYQVLHKRYDIEILGFIDRAASSIGTYQGLPVYLPEHWSDISSSASILLVNGGFEQSMYERLQQLGCPDKKIIRVLTSAEYRRYAQSYVQTYAESFKLDSDTKPNVFVISTMGEHWSILSTKQLERLLPDAQVVNLVFGRSESAACQVSAHMSGYWPAFDLKFSVDVMKVIVEQNRPDLVYMKISPHVQGEALYTWFKETFPEIPVVVEFYDMSGLFLAERLSESFLWSNLEQAMNRFSNADALNRADIIVNKNCGPLWETLAKNAHCPCLTYFPGLEAPLVNQASSLKEDGAPIKLVFAGGLSAYDPVIGQHEQSDLNFMAYFERLANDLDIALDIFNSTHISEKQDYRFLSYIEAFADHPRVSYNRCVPYDQLMDSISCADAGWFVCHDDTENILMPVSLSVIGNRFLGYINAGLPIIIDRSYIQMVEMVERFEAGLVLGWNDRDTMCETIKKVDWTGAKLGVKRLQKYLIDQNKETEQTLRNYFRSLFE